MNKVLLVLIILLFTTSGCSTASSHFFQKAKKLGFHAVQFQGTAFKHTIFKNKVSNNKNLLHVYLGGDGTPWLDGRYITGDPTPQKPVMLDLMRMDKVPAIYLGRPCYHQSQMPASCHKSLWTSKRYSEIIVSSMAMALNRYIQHKSITKIRLFGFSGGGALAMLLASRIPKVVTVVTLAGNLDTDAWTLHHGYLPLTGSLNPAKQPPLALHIQQYHLAARLDKSVPEFIIKSVANKQRNANYILLKNADHHCCWSSIWPTILSKFN